MSGGGRGRKPKSGLTAEEQLLWEHAAATMTPLRRAKKRVPDGADEAVAAPCEAAPKRRAKSEKAATAPLPGLPAAPAPVPVATRTQAKADGPALANFDRKAARRLRAGRIEIEARLDLHGLRQDEAHGALRRFLFSCHAQEKRWVLVITGKGAPRRSAWALDDHDIETRQGAMGRDQPRGILRRNVPRWLAEPELAAIVVSHTEAAIQHGGEGAIYVQLRRR
jgi:DNA-nicking Smr family endonuclease